MNSDPNLSSEHPLQLQRRRFIIRQLRIEGKVSFKELQFEYPGIKHQTAYDDIESVAYMLGRDVQKLVGADGLFWVDNSSKLKGSHESRKKINFREKRIIAALLSGLVFGQKEFSKDEKARYGNQEAPRDSADVVLNLIGNSENEKEVIPMLSRQFIQNALKTQNAAGASLQTLLKKLEKLWAQSSVMVAMDSSTTSSIFVDGCLSFVGRSDLSLPLRNSNLGNLSVVTNNPAVFTKLGDPDLRNLRAVIVGGYHIQRGQAVGGYLAEQFLQVTNLRFGMAIVGTTIVDLKHERIGSGSDRDISVKEGFLERAEIRVITADSSKFVSGGFKAAAEFGRLSPDFVDLIVTDSVSNENRKILNDLGVSVLSLV